MFDSCRSPFTCGDGESAHNRALAQFDLETVVFVAARSLHRGVGRAFEGLLIGSRSGQDELRLPVARQGLWATPPIATRACLIVPS